MAKKERSRRGLFKLMAMGLPFLLLLFVELGLRWGQVGYDLSLFLAHPQTEGYVYYNPQLAYRYFLIEDNAVRGFSEPFLAEKPDSVTRIFVLGASTTVGFPYYRNGAFHRMLQFQLEQNYPDRHFEVINLGLTAVNSYALWDIARELPRYDPDMVLMYAGHNEYYGALGVGATGALGKYPPLVHLLLRARRLRTVQWVQRLLNKERQPDLQRNLMERMVEDQHISWNSPAYHRGVAQFRYNLERLLDHFREEEIGLIIATVFSNETDLVPFRSDPPPDSTEWQPLYQAGLEAYRSGSFSVAGEYLQAALKLHPQHAAAWYWLGKCRQGMALPEAANRAFGKARDLDALRFRAPDTINQVIRELSAAHGHRLLDLEAAARKRYGGYIGANLLHEHVHPRLEGYRFMAESFMEALRERGVLPLPDTGRSPARTDWAHYPITVVDSLYGEYGIQILKEGWPFFEPLPAVDSSREKSYEEALAGGLVVHQLSWRDAMNRLYSYYLQQQQPGRARQVALAVAQEASLRADLYVRAARISNKLGQYELEGRYYERAYRREPHPQLARMAALAWVAGGQLQRAAAFLAPRTLEDPFSKELLATIRKMMEQERQLQHRPQDIALLVDLARSYILTGHLDRPKELLDRVLEREPEHEKARLLLDRIRQRDLREHEAGTVEHNG